MSGSRAESEADWITPTGFETLSDQVLSLGFGTTSIDIIDTRFHIHKIASNSKSHIHPAYQILFYLKGEGVQSVGRQRLTVKPHTAVFIPPNITHRFRPSSGTVAEVFALQFAIDVQQENGPVEEGENDFHRLTKMLYRDQPQVARLTGEDIREANQLLEQLQDELSLQRFGYVLAAKGCILLLLRIFLRAVISGEKDAKPLVRAQLIYLRATSHVRNNLEYPLTVAAIAEVCQVSASYLQKIFNQYHGRTLSSYIQEIRMTRAAHLLRTTDLQIKQIASCCGINDRNYFTRLFRKIHGISPRACRQR